MATTPPGWYDDGRGALRWWDGQQWTEHVQTPDPEISLDTPAADETAAADEAVAADETAAAEAPAADTPASDVPVLEPALAADIPSAGAPGEDPPSAPPGYPGGFTGGPAPAGGFIAATEPKKSKLWILWVVLGVVLLGVVIVAAVLIPLLIGVFSNAGSGDADESAAVAAVQLYDEAWGTVDCDKFIEATTEALRTELQMTDCEAFNTASTSFSTSVENYTLTVTAVERDDDEILVQTSETYDSLYDDEGNPVDEPIPYEDRYEYTVVPSDGGWAIDDLDSN
jgi:Protein of unknown function (DUF2510)